MECSQVQKVLKIVWKKGLITSREASRQGIHSQILTRLVREGTIERITQGQYREPDTQLPSTTRLPYIASVW
jgi:predicted transcriptional regulator of viral defense system